MNTGAAASFQLGKQQGHSAGFHAGWRDGACEWAKTALLTPLPEVVPLRVLYIPQGSLGFDAIDSGIVLALQKCVSEVHVGVQEGLLQQVTAIQPDIVLVLNGLYTFPPDHLEHIAAIRAMGIKTVIWFVDDPYMTAQTIQIAPHYEVVLTHERGTVELYRQHGCLQVHHLPLAVNDTVFGSFRAEKQYQYDICFIGVAFWNRVELIDSIAEQLSRRKVFIAGGHWDRLKNHHLLKPSIHMDSVLPEMAAHYYNGSKIVINMHRSDIPGPDNPNMLQMPGLSVNPRTYDVSACATLQLTDIREDLATQYRPGHEIETYGSAQELVAKLDYYLSHEEERLRIAMRGMYRTLRHHTMTSRIATLVNLLR
ncbi:CgeB family protein [Paenibacillus glycanilyticus]|uniref:Spore maturation protein n=1 Tax=Paenibacillus glycanilyticus TaxID=126569 RepID=A0ABQ6G804_9BACL|nr:glycosyltransferase [Paenibacillus glycanilyticus]GLX67094.1 spore maturation protein [Paenibacillus glycanilyticus]